ESLSPDLYLVDDLNLDSIKAVEAISKAWARLGLTGHLDPGEWVGGTLGEIVRAAEEVLTGTTEQPDESAHARRTHSPWVRGFLVDPVAVALDHNDIAEIGGESVLIVSEDT